MASGDSDRGPAVGPLCLAALLACVASGGAARAELVILDIGAVLKVAGYEVGPRKVRLSLPSGGHLTLPLRRVERIVDDEIAPREELQSPRSAPFELAFGEQHGVPETPHGELIFRKAREHGLNPRLVAAMARVESAFEARAVSSKGARGLMQLMPATAERFGVRGGELFDPERNLDAALRYLRWLAERYPGDLVRILAAYNAGEGTVERFGGLPPYRETRDYVSRVTALLGVGVEEGDDSARGSSSRSPQAIPEVREWQSSKALRWCPPTSRSQRS